MRYTWAGGLILLFMALGVVHAPGLLRHEMSEHVATAASAPRGYGPGLSADGLFNIPLGGSMYDPPHRVKVSWRFRAMHTGPLETIRPYLMFVDGPGDPGNYSSGDGGTVLLQLQTDDASANHFPSGTVLAEVLYTTPKAGGITPLITFPAPLPLLQEGGLYHVVFSNTSPDPYGNFVSLNHLWLDQFAQEIPRQPTVSDIDQHVLVLENQGGWDDTRFFNNTPVFELGYGDGFAQGNGYVEVWSAEPIPPISGANQIREAFIVSGPHRTVSAVSVRAARISGSDPLRIRLETAAGTLLEEATIPDTSFPLGPPGPEGTFPSVWVTLTFSMPRVLISGQSYNLVLTAPSTSTYKAFPVRKAADNGFNPMTYFADGNAQQNDGAGWKNWIPASWGVERPDGNLQFYFVVVP